MFPCLLVAAMGYQVNRLMNILTAKAVQALVARGSELQNVQSLLQGPIIALTVVHLISLAWDVPSIGAWGRSICRAAPVVTLMAIILATVTVPLAMEATFNLYVGTREHRFFEEVLRREVEQIFHGPPSVLRSLCLLVHAAPRPCLHMLSTDESPPWTCSKFSVLPANDTARTYPCPCKRHLVFVACTSCATPELSGLLGWQAVLGRH